MNQSKKLETTFVRKNMRKRGKDVLAVNGHIYYPCEESQVWNEIHFTRDSRISILK